MSSPCECPPPPAFFSFTSTIAHSVLSSELAMLAGFFRATRSTLVGTMMPAFNMSSNTSVAAVKPKLESLESSTVCATRLPLRQPFAALCLIGALTARS